MKYGKLLLLVVSVILCNSRPSHAASQTPAKLLAKVKAAEKAFVDVKFDSYIVQANKRNVADMGGADFMQLEKAVVLYKKPGLLRVDGYAQKLKATYIQNNYTKLFLMAMMRQKNNMKDQPGKLQDTLDLGFLSSKLWIDNYVTIIGSPSASTIKIKIAPRFGSKDKRHDFVWLDANKLRLIKREKYRGNGDLRIKTAYSSYQNLTPGLPIATKQTLFDNKSQELGTIEWTDVAVNTKIKEALFSLSTK